MSKLMGIGRLGHMMMPIRKFRHSFQGFDKNQNLVFEESIVKPSHRVFNEGALTLKQYFWFCSDAERQRFESLKESFKNVDSGLLITYDGCGNPIEAWKLHKVKMGLNHYSRSYCGEDFTAEWSVDYDGFDYVTLVFLGNKEWTPI